MTFSWLGVSGCDLFFGWVRAGMCEGDLLLAGCGWLWVSVFFF